MQFISIAVLIKRIKALKAFLSDKSASKWKKVVIVWCFGLLYCHGWEKNLIDIGWMSILWSGTQK